MVGIKNILGLPIAQHYIMISETKALNKKTGIMTSIDKIKHLIPSVSEEKPEPIMVVHDNAHDIKREVEHVESVTRTRIDLSLISDVRVPIKDGFLIEVFLSGTDGKLTRVYQKDIVDQFTGDIVREGFENYLILQKDK